jgi:hypothetical protein
MLPAGQDWWRSVILNHIGPHLLKLRRVYFCTNYAWGFDIVHGCVRVMSILAWHRFMSVCSRKSALDWLNHEHSHSLWSLTVPIYQAIDFVEWKEQ